MEEQDTRYTEMSTLHIVGNGFDLAHGINSRYTDFKDFAWHNCINYWNLGLLETCYPDINPMTGELELWCDLEKALGNMDFHAALRETAEDIKMEDGHEGRYQAEIEDAPGSFLPGMFDDFHNLFENWVNQIDLSNAEPRRIIHFDSLGKFLTFNYTDTLEKLYGIGDSQVKHIHGKCNTNDELVVGHCNVAVANDELSDDPTIYDYQAFEDIAQIVNEQHKNVSEIIMANHDYWRSLADVDKVVVYGHSLSEVDAPYFSEVIQHIQPDAKWHFSVYYSNPIQQVEEKKRVDDFIDRMGLDPNLCQTCYFPTVIAAVITDSSL